MREKPLINISAAGRFTSQIPITKPLLKNQLKQPIIQDNPERITTAQSVDAVSRRHTSTRIHFLERSQKYDSFMDSFIASSKITPFHACIEECLRAALNATNVTIWLDIPSLHLLYNKRLKKSVTHSDGLIGHVFFSREIANMKNPVTHTHYSPEQDTFITPTPTVMFPLWDQNSNVCAVIVAQRDAIDDIYTDDDEEFIKFFQKKFRLYSNWLMKTQFPHEFILEILEVTQLEQYLLLIQRRLPQIFDCKSCELWHLDLHTHTLRRFIRNVTTHDYGKSGIVGDALLRECPINVAINKMQSSFDESVDGSDTEAVLVVPVVDNKHSAKWAVCLRGRKELDVYTTEDESLLRTIAPYIVQALDNAMRHSDAVLGHSKDLEESKCISALTNISIEITKCSNLKDIMKYAVTTLKDLCHSKRIYFFIPKQDFLETIEATDCKTPLRIDQDKGLVGKCFQTKEIINLTDAYDDPTFDSSFDVSTNFHTKSIVTCPILSNRRDVIAVIQLLNRIDHRPFSSTDMRYVNIFTTLIGLLLENESLYTTYTENNKQLCSFLNVSLSLTTNSSIKTVLNDIIQNARQVVRAERASLFILDPVLNVLISYLVDGGDFPSTIPLGNGIAATAVKTKESIIVNDAYHDPRFNKMIDFHTGFRTNSVMAVPVITPEGEAIGVAEMINKEEPFTQQDLTLLQSLSTFAAMTIQTNRLKEITQHGSCQIEMAKWIGEFERNSYETPSKLVLQPNKQEDLAKLDFFAIDWNGIGLFKAAFYIFKSFNILEPFQITNEMFFTFLYKLRSIYNEPPYHNWIHAIDVLQYISYQVKRTSMHQILTQHELLAVCVAALSHDAGHQGFNNAFNVNAQTPLGILFKDLSVMETHHCEMCISVISQPDCNLFHSFNTQQTTKMWKWIIHLILATDMAFHFKLIKQGNEILDSGAINLAEESHRLMAMELLMKVSDISNVSRPFEIADKWCEVLSEEFYRQGDREKELGLEYSSTNNIRGGQNKAKGQIGFYNFICLPLYTLIARIYPELTVNLDSVKHNLETWKEILKKEEETLLPGEK